MRKIYATYDIDNRVVKNSLGEILPENLEFGLREQVILCLTLTYADGTAVVFGATDTFSAAIDTDFDQTTALMVKTENAGINVPGDWDSTDPTAGKLSIRLDCNTTGFSTKLGTAAGVAAKFELQFHDAGAAALAGKFLFDVTCNNLVDDNSSLPDPTTPANYYTKTELDALLAAKVSAVGASDIEITDSSKGLILRTAAGVRARITVVSDGGVTTWQVTPL